MSCKAIGIDLGTTYSCVGVYRNGKVEIITDDSGCRTIPSVVAFTDTERLVGDAARDQGGRNPENTIFGVKRLIGRKYDETVVQSDIKLFPFKVVEKNSQPMIQAKFKKVSRVFNPEEISAVVLRKMKNMAEKFLGHDVNDAVITVPAYFNDGQRQATKDAATIAGLNAIRIINEPTAAAIAYGLENGVVDGRNVLIFDLGGGTFDVSIVRVSRGPKFEVISTLGDSHLGGEDFDQRLLKYCVDAFERKHSIDISKDPRALHKLRNVSEKSKRMLSVSTEVEIEVDSLYNGIDFSQRISRARFEDLCNDLFIQTIETVKEAIANSGIEKSNIADVVLVGGSTRIPKIQRILKEYFNNIELKYSINPDEAVAFGAAVQAAKLVGTTDTSIRELHLLDVTPLSLGTDLIGDVYSIIINRNSPIPIKNTERYFTAYPGQTNTDVKVFEGENPVASKNHKLGNFLLSGIIPENHGPHDITFEIDLNGILHVTAVAVQNGVQNSIDIKYDKGRLSPSEIEKLVHESENCERESSDITRRCEALGKLEAYSLLVMNEIEAHGSRISESDARKAKEECSKSAKWIEENHSAAVEDFQSKLNALKIFCDPLLARMNTRLNEYKE